ncbi:MAG: cyclic nucleotide-binding domain-containing protein, partial [Spirulina sp.]
MLGLPTLPESFYLKLPVFDRIPEKQVHFLRWLLTIGWLILIVSLFYDPVSPYLTEPENTWSVFHLDAGIFDAEKCQEFVTVQGKCLPEQPYPLGAKIFWVMVVPTAISILLFLGHETWRRICPLAFMSQIARALGKQRKRKKLNPKTQAIRYELAKVRKDSWLARNHLYLQFGLLCGGLCARILFVNSHRLLLGIFFVLTILSAIAIGYLYSGKSWCQYFCPMAPVEMMLTGPRALFGSKAHQGDRKKITQSTCRAIDKSGTEKNACVGCQSPCIDIDAERNYWEIVNKPGRRFIHYGYLGLVLGFYLYYFFYSGTLKYYFSGAINHEENQLQTLLDPGFYLFGQIVPIPKLIAAPLTITVFVLLSYFLLRQVERLYYSYRRKRGKPLSLEQIRHQIFTLSTFAVFNIYFIFGGRLLVELFPVWLQFILNASVIAVSALWMYRTLNRTSQVYARESLANSLRRQLSKLNLNLPKFLEGRSIADLKPDEIYVLAKVLPSFSKESSFQVYKGVLRDALEQGNVQPANSFERLEQLRLELEIKEEEHYNLLTELGIENPDLLNPAKTKTKESQLRLESYQEALELQLLDLLEMGIPLSEAIARRDRQIRILKQEYSITVDEEEALLAGLADPGSMVAQKAAGLLELLQNLSQRDRALRENISTPDAPEFILLRSLCIDNKQKIVLQQLFSILEVLGEAPEAQNIATSIARLSKLESRENILNQPRYHSSGWEGLDKKVLAILKSSQNPEKEAELLNAIAILEECLQELEPLIQAVALYAIHQLDRQKGKQHAEQFLRLVTCDELVRETAEHILLEKEERLTKEDLVRSGSLDQTLGSVEKWLLLLEIELFQAVKPEISLELARESEIYFYPRGVYLCQQGDLSHELFLLIEGSADVTILQGDTEVTINTISAGTAIGEMGILTRQTRSANVVTSAEQNRVLVVKAGKFEAALEKDSEVTKQLLLEALARLQRLTTRVQNTVPKSITKRVKNQKMASILENLMTMDS